MKNVPHRQSREEFDEEMFAARMGLPSFRQDYPPVPKPPALDSRQTRSLSSTMGGNLSPSPGAPPAPLKEDDPGDDGDDDEGDGVVLPESVLAEFALDASMRRFIPQGSEEIKAPDGIPAVAYIKPYTRHAGAGGPTEMIQAMGFMGNQSKPVFNYSFRTREAAMQQINQMFDNAKAWKERVAARAQARKDYKHSVEVGSIFYTSWGYDQTNVDFYEVVRVPSEKSVVVRKVGQKSSAVDANADRVSADKGHFVGPEKTCRVTGGYQGSPTISVDGHSAWLDSPNATHHQTAFGAGH